MYTEEEVTYLLETYTASDDKQEILNDLSSQLNKSRRSIIGKLSRLGVYQKKIYLTKRGESPITKQELVHKLSIQMHLPLDLLEGLDKAPKQVLKLLLENSLT